MDYLYEDDEIICKINNFEMLSDKNIKKISKDRRVLLYSSKSGKMFKVLVFILMFIYFIIKNLKKNTIIVGDFDDETQIKHCYFKYINVKNLKSEAESFSRLAEEKFNNNEMIDSAEAEPLYLKDFNFKKV